MGIILKSEVQFKVICFSCLRQVSCYFSKWNDELVAVILEKAKNRVWHNNFGRIGFLKNEP